MNRIVFFFHTHNFSGSCSQKKHISKYKFLNFYVKYYTRESFLDAAEPDTGAHSPVIMP